MKPENRIPFIGVLLSGVASYLLVHFWLADLGAKYMAVSRDTSYHAMVTLVVLLTGWRAWRTAQGKDEVSNWIDKRLGK